LSGGRPFHASRAPRIRQSDVGSCKDRLSAWFQDALAIRLRVTLPEELRKAAEQQLPVHAHEDPAYVELEYVCVPGEAGGAPTDEPVDTPTAEVCSLAETACVAVKNELPFEQMIDLVDDEVMHGAISKARRKHVPLHRSLHHERDGGFRLVGASVDLFPEPDRIVLVVQLELRGARGPHGHD
jgi:hypothetical protein